MDSRAKVIIVGAGISGIMAAKTLSDAGIDDIIILEATNRIGGRIQKHKFAGLNVELGANWVEGVGGPEINPIWEIAKELNLKTYCSEFEKLSSHIFKQEGGLYEESESETAFELAESLVEHSKEVSANLSSYHIRDISILTSQRLQHHVPSNPLEMAIDYFNYDYEYAEPPRTTSLKNVVPLPTFTDFGEEVHFVADPRGYETIVHNLAGQFLTTDRWGNVIDPRLILNQVVRNIDHSDDSNVIVETEDGKTYEADYVMVSVSIGVLQTDLITFEPDLPSWKILDICKFDMAVYTKIFLKFPYKFWPTGVGAEFFLYAHQKRGYYTVWQHLEKEYPGSNVLVVSVTDDESRRIEQQSDHKTKKEAMAVLRNMFGKDIPEATNILVPRWWTNRFFKGTFSNWPIGVSRSEYDQIRAPVGRIYFTGEHTSERYNGYVHGAYLAGIDSANMLIEYINEEEACGNYVEPEEGAYNMSVEMNVVAEQMENEECCSSYGCKHVQYNC